jgi:hypothetical protein
MLPGRPGRVRLLAIVFMLGCGARSALEERATPDAGGTGAGSPRDGGGDGGHRGDGGDGGDGDGGEGATGTPCRWAPALDPGGGLAPPVRVDVERVLAVDVQLVAYDRGFYLLVPGVGETLVYARFDDVVGAVPEIYEGSALVGLEPGGLARHGATSNGGILCNGGFVPRPDDGRLGFVFSDPCAALVSGGDRAFAFLTPTTGAQIAELRLTERSESLEIVHDVATGFPPEVLGATFDARASRAVFLVGEIRDALSTDRLFLVEVAQPPREVVLPEAGFRRLWDVVALDSGDFASIDLADVPVLRVFDEEGAPRDEIPASIDFFARSGRPGDADLAAYDGGVLANVSGVIVDFAEDGARLVVDELAAGGPTRQGFDVALHGRHAVTATAYLDDDQSRVELRHYTCE